MPDHAPERISTGRAVYSVNEILELYEIGRTKLYKEINAGRLIARKLGTKTLFLAEDVEAWVSSWPVKVRG